MQTLTTEKYIDNRRNISKQKKIIYYYKKKKFYRKFIKQIIKDNF